jgi:hypothetical protein
MAEDPLSRFLKALFMRFHDAVLGSSTRTVVMDSGLGGGVLDWQTVQPKAG